MIKNNKGITLIALVVAIIVLLILAGISLAMLTGSNGLLSKAKKAGEDSTIGEEQERVAMAYSGALTTNMGKEVTAEDMNKELERNQTNAIASGEEMIMVRFLETNHTYKINVNGNITGPYLSLTLAEMYRRAEEDECYNLNWECDREDHLHIGDYVELPNPKSGSITITSEQSGYTVLEEQTYELSKNQLRWRVLGINEVGEVELLSELQMLSNNERNGKADPRLFLYGAKGAKNYPTILNNICNLYKAYDTTGYITTARSIVQDDVNKLLGVTEKEIKENNIYY